MHARAGGGHRRRRGASSRAIEQTFYEVEPRAKAPLLAALLLEHRPESGVVFCNTRRDVDEVAGSLQHYGFTALALHGDMEQRDRDEVLVRFANRSCNVLVASDVAARGLDIEDLARWSTTNCPPTPTSTCTASAAPAAPASGGLALSLCHAARGRARAAHRGTPRARRCAGSAMRRSTGKPGAARRRRAMATLRIDAGRTDKLRPGDIVGALTGDAGLPADAIGKIDVFATRSYVAIARKEAAHALARLREGQDQGQASFRVNAL